MDDPDNQTLVYTPADDDIQSDSALLTASSSQQLNLEAQNGGQTLFSNVNSPLEPVEVRIRLVKQVFGYDFPQAKKAWEALVEAGIEPSHLVANALVEYLGYEDEKHTQLTPFIPQKDNLLNESKISDHGLMGYVVKYEQKQILLSSEVPDNTLSVYNPRLMVIQSQSEIEESKVIDMVAVLPHQKEEIDSNYQQYIPTGSADELKGQ